VTEEVVDAMDHQDADLRISRIRTIQRPFDVHRLELNVFRRTLRPGRAGGHRQGQHKQQA
jgi:hypothetical protein